MYPFIQFFGRSIGTYALIAVFATILCGFIFLISLKKAGAMMEDGVSFLLFVILGVAIGSHLLYAITQYRYIPYLFERVEFSLWIQRVQYIFGGSVFYGGLIGGIAFGLLGLKILKQDVALYADLLSPIVPLLHGITRVGCFFAGCCYGIPCEWGFAARGNALVPEVNGISRFPVQLLEAACNIALAGVMFLMLKRSAKRPTLRGNLFTLYLMVYGVIRFADEFLRGDAIRGHWGIFSTSQWIAIVMVCTSTVTLIVSVKRKKDRS